MIFQDQDEDSGEPVQMNRLARAFSAKKIIESSNRFWMLFHGTMITQLQLCLDMQNLPEVRQSQ